MKALLPPGWPRPKGYANGVSAIGRLVFTAGVIGWDEQRTARRRPTSPASSARSSSTRSPSSPRTAPGPSMSCG